MADAAASGVSGDGLRGALLAAQNKYLDALAALLRPGGGCVVHVSDAVEQLSYPQLAHRAAFSGDDIFGLVQSGNYLHGSNPAFYLTRRLGSSEAQGRFANGAGFCADGCGWRHCPPGEGRCFLVYAVQWDGVRP